MPHVSLRVGRCARTRRPMKYWSPLVSVVRMMRSWSLRVLIALILLAFLHPAMVLHAQAGLTADGGELFLSCREDNDCVLTPTPVGEEVLTGQSTANAFQPETLTFEFVADPPQFHVAVLPDVLTLMEIDFQHQTEAGSFFQPALDIRLVLGQNVNDWSFDGATLPSTSPSPYTLENEALSLSQGGFFGKMNPSACC